MPTNSEKKVEASSNSAFNTPDSKKRKTVESNEQDDKRMKIQQNKSASEELSQAMKSEKINLDMLVNQLVVVKKSIQDMSLDIELAESEVLVLEKKFAMNTSKVKLIGGIKDQLQMLDIQASCLKLRLSQLTDYKKKLTV